jgi:hypothetical protein
MIAEWKEALCSMSAGGLLFIVMVNSYACFIVGILKGRHDMKRESPHQPAGEQS